MPIPLGLLNDCETLQDSRSGSVYGTLDSRAKKIMVVYQRELFLQIFANSASPGPKDDNVRKVGPGTSSCVPKAGASLDLYCILYGPSAYFEAVGTFTAKCGLFLQHPRHCDRRVLYRNPHCLTRENANDIYTQQLDDVLDIEPIDESQIFYNPIDFFAESVNQDVLIDTESPSALRTQLYKHQKQALTFMVQRERGWAMTGELGDIWKAETQPTGRTLYCNTVTGQKQTRPPSNFRGGLLTDAPGLGKSLSIIALIASSTIRSEQCTEGIASSATTLLVVPKTCELPSSYPMFPLQR